MAKQGLYAKQECNIVGILNMEGETPLLEVNGQVVNLINLLKDFDADAMSYYIWCSCRGFNTDIVMRMTKEEAVEIFKKSFKFLLEGIKK